MIYNHVGLTIVWLEKKDLKPMVFCRPCVSGLIGKNFTKLKFSGRQTNKGSNMSKPIAAPINHDTEITREEIAKIAKISQGKVYSVIKAERFGFPKPIRSGPRGKILFDRAVVLPWLENNDIKAIKLTPEERKPMKSKPKVEPTVIDSAAVLELRVGIKPKKFKGHGQSIRVHVPERNDIECPRASLTRFSNSNVEFTALPSYFSGAFE